MKLTKTASGKQTLKLSKKEWQDIGRTAGWMKTAGDEWVDSGTEEFVHQLRSIMDSPLIPISPASGNKITFKYIISNSKSITLSIAVREFGYMDPEGNSEDESQSLNGTITSLDDPSLSFDAGTTLTRDPQDFLQSLKSQLDNIFSRI